VAHIGDFNVGYSAARGNFLELAFEREFRERVNIFAHVHVIAVGIIPLVRHVLYGAETLLIYAGKAVAKRFGRGAVKSKAKPRFLFPLFAVFAERVHYFNSKFRTFGGSVRTAFNKLRYLVEPYISQRYRRITVQKILVDFFAGFKPCNRAVLPVHGRNVARYAHKRIVAAH